MSTWSTLLTQDSNPDPWRRCHVSFRQHGQARHLSATGSSLYSEVIYELFSGKNTIKYKRSLQHVQRLNSYEGGNPFIGNKHCSDILYIHSLSVWNLYTTRRTCLPMIEILINHRYSIVLDYVMLYDWRVDRYIFKLWPWMLYTLTKCCRTVNLYDSAVLMFIHHAFTCLINMTVAGLTC